MRSLARVAAALLGSALSLAGSACLLDGAGGGPAPSGAGTQSCVDLSGVSGLAVSRVCCKALGERAVGTTTQCGRHVVLGCSTDARCALYTDDGKVSVTCGAGLSCGACVAQGDAALSAWCQERALAGD